MGEAGSEKWSVRTEGVVWRRVGDDIILMDLGPSVYHSLRGVGADVWALLADGPLPIGDVVSKLLDEYEVEQALLRSDVESFLQRLQAAGLADLV
ncbi:MAG: PqqD family protein [Acidimicrobiia bacterium]